jgi:uncharacterized protein (TIGR03083 family)
MLREYRAFGELIAGLSDDEWQTPTRCTGWTVADVAAHVVGQLTDVVTGNLEGLGSPEATQREVDERRGRAPAELAEELTGSEKVGTDITDSFDDAAWVGPVPGGGDGTLGFGIEALWADTYIHADDIRAAIGRPSEPSDNWLGAVSHVADVLTGEGWGPATLALDGLPEIEVSGGGGQRITGDPIQWVLAATGRGDPAAFGLDETVNIYRG